MKEQEIARIIRDVLAAEEKVVKQLRAEKRATGDYSKVVTVPYGEMEMRFEVRKTLGQYPPVSFRLRHLVSVMKEGKAIVPDESFILTASEGFSGVVECAYGMKDGGADAVIKYRLREGK